MRCIFCKKDSRQSKSIEHIIPRSLGDNDHTLPRGVVCDGCNNYFARSIEGPLLNLNYFKTLRSRQFVKSKKGRIPSWEGITLPNGIPIELIPSEIEGPSIGPLHERDNKRFIEHVTSSNSGKILLPVSGHVDEKLMSRFLAKVGLEIIAMRAHHLDGWETEIVDNSTLDPIREYARRGNPQSGWSYHSRRIYDEDRNFGSTDRPEQVIHEFDLLYTDSSELYVVVCIFGVEYAMNLSGDSIMSYLDWLTHNKNQSPMYPNGELQSE